MLRVVVALILLVAASSGSARELWLIGGGADPVCASTDPQECQPEKRDEALRYFDQQQSLRVNKFQVTQARRDALFALPRWNGGDERRDFFFRQLDALRAKMSDRVMEQPEWHALLQAMVLTEDELQLFDDAFEFRPVGADGRTQRDSVYLNGSDAPAQALYRDFVALAAQHSHVRKPLVLVITASSQNVFGSVYYYLSLFEQAGAQVDWLALEPAVARSRDCADLDTLRYAENGSYARDARYPELAAVQRDQCAHPEKMRALIDRADGIFIDGGDQTLTIRSLQLTPGVFTDLGKRLLARIDAGVPLGGTSAGTAVQSGNAAGTLPMISNGTTSHALRYGALAGEPSSAGCPMTKPCTLNVPTDQVTYRASGGLRTFELGVLDTHFFERQREGRQVRLLLDSDTPFAFGIDESTVLHVRDGPDGTKLLRVQGHGGVWILDVRGARVEQDDEHWQATGFHATRLLDGDSAVWKDGFVSVDLHCPAAASPNEGIDAEAFKAEDGREWTVLPSDAPVTACRRDDGRWRYAKLPLQLRQSLD